MPYDVTTLGAIGDAPPMPYVSCVLLGPGVQPGPRTCWRPVPSFAAAARQVAFMGQVGNLYAPMWSGWVLLDLPSLRHIAPRVRAAATPPTAWHIW